MFCYVVINNFFVSLETSGSPYNSLQNTLRLINKFKKGRTAIADFAQIFSAIVKFLFAQGRLVTKLFVRLILIFS